MTSTAYQEAARRDGPPRPGRFERFVMGPIPWSWLVAASRCGAGAMSVAVVLWHLAFLNKTNCVSLTNARLRDLGVSRSQKSRVLRAFCDAGLIKLVTADRRSPVVEIMPITNVPRPETLPAEA